MNFQMDFVTEWNLRNFAVRVIGVCGNSVFCEQWPVFFTHAVFSFTVKNPMLWWPTGYGEPNLYDVKVELLHQGETVADTTVKLGIRTIILERTDLNKPEEPGKFGFIVNGENVFVKGTNWLPADAFHSRDAERIPQIFDLIQEMNCNIIRIWGGGVYETHQFYDLCDKLGIMVWQDFAMACAVYPQQEEFLDIIRQEAVSEVISLRRHPSLALWSGDNEVDSGIVWGDVYGNSKKDPGKNRISREILPEVIRLYNPTTSYLPSSPYFSPSAFELALQVEEYIDIQKWIPEGHYYPHGLYFKEETDYLVRPLLMSELGCLGCPNMSSLEKYIPQEHLSIPDPEDPMWRLHSTEPVPEFSSGYRIKQYNRQVEKMFGSLPDTLEEYVVQSQIAQAEGLKYMVELFRQRKGEATGIIWWNIIDGCAQMSDAITDYYFSKKLAFHYMKRIHGEVCVMMMEPSNHFMTVVAVNDTLKEKDGTFTVKDADNGTCVREGSFHMNANGKTVFGKIPVPSNGSHLYLIEWQCDGIKGCNHYLYGMPPFDYQKYRKEWLPKIAALDGQFSAENVGK